MPKRLRHMMMIGLAVMAYGAAAGAQPTAPPTSSAPEAPATIYAPVNMDGRKLFEVPAPDVLVDALYPNRYLAEHRGAPTTRECPYAKRAGCYTSSHRKSGVRNRGVPDQSACCCPQRQPCALTVVMSPYYLLD